MNIKKKGNIALILFRIMSIIIVIICLWLLYDWNQNNIENDEMQEELTSFTKLIKERDLIEVDLSDVVYDPKTGKREYTVLSVDFEGLRERNSDTVAWVKLNNTNIDFPVVKAEDNNYYLKRNFNRKSNGAGWIYADYRCSFDELSRNTIIYGHNRRNGTMFSNMNLLLDNEWFEDENNTKFYFSTASNNYVAKIFSIYSMKERNVFVSESFSSDEEFENYINEIKELSNYDFDIEVNPSDNIITLCTCGNNTNYRILLHAKLVKV